MIPALAELLKRHREKALSNGYASPESYVFATASDLPRNHRNASRAFYSAADKAELNEDGKPQLFTHELRHGFVSFLILELGFDPVRVAEQVGHAKASFTMDCYTHLFKQASYAEAIRQRIAQSVGRVLEERSS